VSVRPGFHFTASSGWINDPHGITVHDGEYHVFYQYIPGRTTWAPNCHWGHAVGRDLFSLTERDPAIEPGDGDDGIWTGSLIESDGMARIFYTAVSVPGFGIGRVRVATPRNDDWNVWQKGDVVVEAPPGLDLIAFRDPFLRRDPDAWRMFVGAGDSAGTAMALSFVSQDLGAWSYEGVALERPGADRDPVWMGSLWECPQIFELDGRFVMLSSVWEQDVLNYAGYAVGSYHAGVFTPESWGRLTYGPSLYAPSLFRDADGRASLVFWMRGVDDIDAGWAGAHSIPYLLGLEADVLTATPHPDLLAYRGRRSPDRRVAGRAADLVWDAEQEVVVSTDLGEMFRIAPGHGTVELTTPGATWSLPRSAGPVRVVIDAQAIELSSDLGVLAVTVPQKGSRLHVEGAGVEIFPLERPAPPG
jgi:beta-fructofuranosidase